MRVTAAACALVVAAGCHGHGDKPSLAEQIEQVRVAEHLPALAMAVWKHGQLVATVTTGLRKSDDPVHLATGNDRWHLGSDTKAMTATLVGLYVDRGLIRWDDTVGKLFAGETIDPALAKVTVDQLLEHRGGLPHSAPVALSEQLIEMTDVAEARRIYVRAMLAAPPSETIGTFSYSNVGYTLLGAALERATGKPWEQLMHDDLFAPLGITACGFGVPDVAGTVAEPWGHRFSPVPPGPHADNPLAMAPAGCVNCSLADWGKFLNMQAGVGPALLTGPTFAHLHAMPEHGHAYMGGWAPFTMTDGTKALAHEGSNTMWHAIAIVSPDKGEAIAVVANHYDEGLLRAMLPALEPYLR